MYRILSFGTASRTDGLIDFGMQISSVPDVATAVHTKEQPDYTGVLVAGPFKGLNYRY